MEAWPLCELGGTSKPYTLRGFWTVYVDNLQQSKPLPLSPPPVFYRQHLVASILVP